MLGHRGRSPTTIGVKVTRSYTWCHSNNQVIFIKNARFKCQPSTPMQPFVSKEAYLLWKLMTKEERLEQRYEMHHGEKYKLDMDNGQRGSNIEELRRIKILGQEKHTSRGSKLMNLFVCIWFVHSHVLACIA